MTVAAAQRIMNVAIDLPDEAEGPVINFMVSYKVEKPELDKTDVSYRIGAGEGEFDVPEDFDAGQDEIYAEMER